MFAATAAFSRLPSFSFWCWGFVAVLGTGTLTSMKARHQSACPKKSIFLTLFASAISRNRIPGPPPGDHDRFQAEGCSMVSSESSAGMMGRVRGLSQRSFSVACCCPPWRKTPAMSCQKKLGGETLLFGRQGTRRRHFSVPETANC